MEKVKIYNVKDYIEKLYPDEEIYRNEKLMILVGERRVVVRDYEGCGVDKNIITDSIPIQTTDIPEENHIYLVPQYEKFVVIKDIIDNAECEEMYLKEFLHKWNYNSRCERNYDITLESMKFAMIDASLYVEEEVVC